jgi:hypothetical protein
MVIDEIHIYMSCAHRLDSGIEECFYATWSSLAQGSGTGWTQSTPHPAFRGARLAVAPAHLDTYDEHMTHGEDEHHERHNGIVKEVMCMPRFDGTGPTGQGPMTGRGLGNCVPQASQLNAPRRFPVLSGLGQRLGLRLGRGTGRGAGRGRGLVRGRGRGAGRGRRW